MKIALFSHIADCDGLTPVILSKLTFDQVDYFLAEVKDIDAVFLEQLSYLSQYDFIFMTDICLSEKVILQIPEAIQHKFLIFDHHISNMPLNKYPFITVMEEDENHIMQCGTTLYYQYLLTQYPNDLLQKESIKTLVSLVRSGDTWQWANDKEEALRLGAFLALVGKDEYIRYFYDYILKHDTFAFEEKLQYALELNEKNIQLYIKEKEKQIIPMMVEQYHIGCVFAEQNRSILGNTLATKYAKEYDFIIVVNISRSISYRSVKDIDISMFAARYGGSGHPKAAGSPLPNHIQDDILLMLFPDAKVGKRK